MTHKTGHSRQRSTESALWSTCLHFPGRIKARATTIPPLMSSWSLKITFSLFRMCVHAHTRDMCMMRHVYLRECGSQRATFRSPPFLVFIPHWGRVSCYFCCCAAHSGLASPHISGQFSCICHRRAGIITKHSSPQIWLSACILNSSCQAWVVSS